MLPLVSHCQYFFVSSGVETLSRTRLRDSHKVMTIDGARDNECPRSHQIRQVSFHNINARGPMYARSMARKVLANEEFCLQLDAHSGLAPHWDTLLQNQWEQVDNEFGVISTVPPPKSSKNEFQPGGTQANEVPRTCRVRFHDNGFPDYDSPADGKAMDLEEPLLSMGWSAAFSFHKCHLVL